MRLRNLLKVVLLASVSVFSIAAHAQSDPNAVFATVNGDEIKSGEFWHRLAWYRVDPQSPLAQLPAGFLAINQLITEKLVFQMARQKGVSPTDQQIAAEVKEQEDENPTLLSDLKGEGRPESDLYEQVKYQLVQFNLRTFGITITDQEVEQHYKDYPSEYTTPKRYKLRVIVVGDDTTASSVDKDLAAGKSFQDVAGSYSLDVSKGKGGEFGTVASSQLGAPALKALAAVKIGDTTSWVEGTQANSVRVKYLLEDILPPSLHPLDAPLRKKIREKLSQDKGDVKNTVFKDLHDATINAKVVINQAGFQKIYDQMIKQYSLAHPKGQ